MGCGGSTQKVSPDLKDASLKCYATFCSRLNQLSGIPPQLQKEVRLSSALVACILTARQHAAAKGSKGVAEFVTGAWIFVTSEQGMPNDALCSRCPPGSLTASDYTG